MGVSARHFAQALLASMVVLWVSSSAVQAQSTPRLELIPAVVRAGEAVRVAVYRIGGCYQTPDSFSLTISGNTVTLLHTVQFGSIGFGNCVEIFDIPQGLPAGNLLLVWVEAVSNSQQQQVIATLSVSIPTQGAAAVVPTLRASSLIIMAVLIAMLAVIRRRRTDSRYL